MQANALAFSTVSHSALGLSFGSQQNFDTLKSASHKAGDDELILGAEDSDAAGTDCASGPPHLVEKMKVKKRKFRCAHCSTRFMTMSKAMRHAEKHLKEANFKSRSLKELPPTEEDIFGGSSDESTDSTPYPETPHHINGEASPDNVNGVCGSGSASLNGPNNQCVSNGDSHARGSFQQCLSETMGQATMGFSSSDFGQYSTPLETSREHALIEPASSSSVSTLKGSEKNNLDKDELVREVVYTLRSSGFCISGLVVPEPETPLICRSCGVRVESEEQLQKHMNVGSYIPGNFPESRDEKHAAAFCNVCNIHFCKGHIFHLIHVQNHKSGSTCSREEYERLFCSACRLQFTTNEEFIMHFYEIQKHYERLSQGKDYRIFYDVNFYNAPTGEAILDYERQQAIRKIASTVSKYGAVLPLSTAKAPPELTMGPPPSPEHRLRLQRTQSHSVVRYQRLRNTERVPFDWAERKKSTAEVLAGPSGKRENARRVSG